MTGASPISKVKLARTGEFPPEDMLSVPQDVSISAVRNSSDPVDSQNGFGVSFGSSYNQPSTCVPCPDSPVSPDASMDVEVSKTGTKFNLHGAFCCHEDWRHSHHAAYVNRTKVWNDLRHRGVNSLMYLWQTDRCANDYWSGPAFASHIMWIDSLGLNGSRLVMLSFFE